MVAEMHTITIRTETSAKQVQAVVFGDWAAHPAHCEAGWCVTHVQHGRRLNAELTEQQARAAAAALCERLPVLRWREGELPHPDDVAIARRVLAEVMGS